MALSKSGIEYLTHVWNFYTGCRHTLEQCPCADKCWAKANKKHWTRKGDVFSFLPELHPEKLLDPLKGKQGGRRIGVCFTGDLFGGWVDPDQVILQYFDKPVNGVKEFDGHLKAGVFDVIKRCPNDQFFFLTKAPQNLHKWDLLLDNAWVGATVCNQEMLKNAIWYLSGLKAKNKWISFEPLMEQLIEDDQVIQLASLLSRSGFKWLVIGGWSKQSDYAKHPLKIEWVKEIVKAADQAGIPVFLKNNLAGLLPHEPPFWKQTIVKQNMGDMESPTGMVFSVTKTETTNGLRQELPEVK